MMKRGTVVVSFFGDGAMNEGAFHEAANLAAIWKLPVVALGEMEMLNGSVISFTEVVT